MSIEAQPSRGYTLGLACRHLFSGVGRPGLAMREALAAGFDERSRLSIVVVCGWCSLLAARGSLGGTAEALGKSAKDQTIFEFVFILSALFVTVSLFLIAWYAIESLLVFVFLRLFRVRDVKFQQARSAVAMSGWASAIPTTALTLLWGLRTTNPDDQHALLENIVMIVIGTPYLAICLCNSAEVSLGMAFIASILSGAVLIIVWQLLDTRLDLLLSPT